MHQTQIYIEFSKEKNIIYTANSSGCISTWDIEKIFEKSFNQKMYQRDSFKLVYKEKPIYEQVDLTYMLNIDEL